MSAMPVKISFGRSSSANYTTAVRLAESLSGYTSTGEGKQQLHIVSFDLSLDDGDSWQRLRKLMDIVRGWQSASICIAGRLQSYWEMDRRLTAVLDCYQTRTRGPDNPNYCSGADTVHDEPRSFGCRLLEGVHRPLRNNYSRRFSWCQFGQLTDDCSAFIVDKEAIVQEIRSSATDSYCEFCPAFDWSRVEADVDFLPDRVDVEGSSSFELRFSEINPDKPIGIKPKQPRTSFGVTISAADVLASLTQDQPVARNVPDVRYTDIGGQDPAIAHVRELVELPLTHPEYFRQVGVRSAAGILLYGPPGNGKTMLAKAVATESNAHLEFVSGPEVLSKWVGETERAVREMFDRARKLEPSVVLIDELDSIAPRRSQMQQQHDVQLISQILVLMDGMQDRGNVALVATTNRLEAIDPAVLRPGRFDCHIHVPNPDSAGRQAILRAILTKMRTERSVCVKALALSTDDFSGADLANLCREAGLSAIKRGIQEDTPPDLLAVNADDFANALQAVAAKRVTLDTDE